MHCVRNATCASSKIKLKPNDDAHSRGQGLKGTYLIGQPIYEK